MIGHSVTSPDKFRSELDLSKTVNVTKAVVSAVLTGMRYLEIRRYQDIRALANRFLESSADPSRDLDGDLEKKIDDASVIRNHIVHESRQSEKAYERVLARQGLRGWLRKPGFFLLASSGGSGRIQVILRGFRSAMTHLRKR